MDWFPGSDLSLAGLSRCVRALINPTLKIPLTIVRPSHYQRLAWVATVTVPNH
jgi:hypothetical protein